MGWLKLLKISPILNSFSFCYEDIYLNHYEQNFDVLIGFDKEKSGVFYSIDLSHVQKFLGGESNGENENGIS